MTPRTKGYDAWDLPGTHDHNMNFNDKRNNAEYPSLDKLLRDWKNRDFRPVAGSSLIDQDANLDGTKAKGCDVPDIGAYEFGDVKYWIPGRIYVTASSPVPPNNAVGVRPDADLMFLEG